MSRHETIALMAALMALGALAIDAILPAIAVISADLGVFELSSQQLIITVVFVGMALGLLVFGPLSDTYGRRPIMFVGLVIYIVGSLCSMLSESFTLMIAGRFAQGVGASCCRIITTTIIRDQFSGKAMGQVLSLVMIIFILVPAIAPSLGQLILMVAHWRVVFGLFVVLAIGGSIWFGLRQPETLTEKYRRAFSLRVLKDGALEALTTWSSLCYTLAAGATFGAFIGYLSGSQQILQVLYETGEAFPFYFGSLALAIGISSFLNSKLVMKFDMVKLCGFSLVMVTSFSLIFLLYQWGLNEKPGLRSLLIYLGGCFFFLGTLLANFNALALEPLGHIAGVANSVFGSLQTLLSILLGTFIGFAYDDSVFPLTLGFLLCSLLALVFLTIAVRTAAVRRTESGQSV